MGFRLIWTPIIYYYIYNEVGDIKWNLAKKLEEVDSIIMLRLVNLLLAKYQLFF